MSCNVSKKDTTQSSSTTPVSMKKEEVQVGGKWSLTKIKDLRIDFNEMDASAIPVLTIEVDEKKIGGNDGCNRFFGELTSVTTDEIKFANIGATKMACDLKESYDNQFRSMLEKATSYSITSSSLTLYDSNREALLVFKKS